MESIVSRHRSGVVEVVDAQGQMLIVSPGKGNGGKVMISASTFVKTLDISGLEAMRTQRGKVKPRRAKAQVK